MSNILLLDRNIDEAERISSYFEARSYAVIWPKTIADLLYHVVHRDFCLAILDVALSAEDDHRFLDALRKVKGVPILVLGSDTADAEERLNSLRAGAHAYLCRPYSMEECFAQAQALIQAYSPHMQTRKEENPGLYNDWYLIAGNSDPTAKVENGDLSHGNSFLMLG